MPDNPYLAVADRAQRDFAYCAGELLWIKPKDRPLCKLALNWPQRYILQRYLQPAWEAREPLALLVLKARREGVSTLIRAWHFHKATLFRGQACYLTAHDDDTSQELFRMDRMFYQNLPKRLQPPLVANNRMELEYGPEWGGSSMRVRVAKYMDIGHGKTVNHWHACLRGDTPVLLADGNTCPIRDIEAGVQIRTHTGAVALVKKRFETPACHLPTAGTPLRVIKPWLTYVPIVCTPDHQLWTREGWKPAGQILPGEYLGIPKRHFTESITTLPLVRPAYHGGNRLSLPREIPLTKEIGFLVGYYLAEGSALESHNKFSDRFAALQFSHHRHERASYMARALAAAKDWSGKSHTMDRPDSFSSATLIYGTALATLIATQFGHADSKTIPEWVFDTSPAFAEGIVIGYCAGDGSKQVHRDTQKRSDIGAVTIASVRPRLLVQLRSLLAALDWGWAGLQAPKPAHTDKRGWKNRMQWKLNINGEAAIRIREALGLPIPSRQMSFLPHMRAPCTQRFWVDHDYIWVRVRSVSEAHEEEFVYDLEVGHPDHSYETLSGVVKNSEVAYYPVDPFTGAPAALPGLLEAVPTTGRSSIIWETTAVQADSWFHAVWIEAERNKHKRVGYGNRHWQTVFLPWFWHADHQAEWLAEFEPLGKEEQEIQRRFKLSMQQMAWRRGKIEELQIEYPGQGFKRFGQQYPATSEEPFLLAGSCVFPEEALDEMRRQERPPSLGFNIVRTGQWRCNLVAEQHLDAASLVVWEPPRQGCEYAIGVDVSRGVGRDDSAVVVMAMPGYKVVAHWYDNYVAPKQLAYLVAAIARYYGVRSGTLPICTVEINDAGILVNSELEGMRGYEPLDIYVWEYWDTVGRQMTTKTGWQTTQKTKDLMLGVANSLMLGRLTFQPSAWIRADMGRTIEIRPGVAKTGGCDLVIAWLLALVTAYRKIARFHDPEGVMDLARGQGDVFSKSFASDEAATDLREAYGEEYVYKDKVFYDVDGDKIRRGVGGKSIVGAGALW